MKGKKEKRVDEEEENRMKKEIMRRVNMGKRIKNKISEKRI